MDINNDYPRLKVFGSIVVSPRGQVVIPAKGRKELNIAAGDTLLACGVPSGKGLLLLKVDVVERILSEVNKQFSAI
jgi:AbrB family looped-hinge helix DNA binding protein